MSHSILNGYSVNGHIDFDAIRAKNPLRDVLKAHGVDFGRDNRCVCPIHPADNGGNPSGFHLLPDEERAYCHVCKGRWDVFDFYLAMHPECLDINGAAKAMDHPPVEPSWEIACTYDYNDEEGNLLFQVVRKRDRNGSCKKTFVQRRPDGNGGWINSVKGTRLVPYRLDDLVKVPEGICQAFFIVEGEKDVDRLWSLGKIATCNPMGAGKWRPEFSQPLQGRTVVIIADADVPGRKHAQDVAMSLLGLARHIRVIEVPRGKDISGFLDDGGTLEEVKAIVKATPEWEPEVVIEDEEDDEDLGIVDLKIEDSKPIDWIFENVLGIGKMMLIAGEGSTGKSQIAVSFGATVSRGTCFPAESEPTRPGRVLILAAEDGKDDTIIPRFVVSGADMNQVHLIKARQRLKTSDGNVIVDPRSFQDLAWWDKLFKRRPGVRLVIADTLPSYMGRGINDKSNSEVKQVLEPFLEFLEERQAALIGIVHIGKSQDARTVRNLILDSVAYPNTARTVFFAMNDPRIPGRRLFCSEKNNVGDLKPTLAYKIVPTSYINPKDGKRIPTSLVDWEPQPDPIALEEVFALQKNSRRGGRPPQRPNSEAIQWLTEFLAKGPQLSETVFIEAVKAGFSKNQMYELKDQAGVRARKSGGSESPWRWGIGDPQRWSDHRPSEDENENESCPFD